MPGRKTLRITAPDNSDENYYIKSMTIDGKTVTRNYDTFDELRSGASIVFNMTDKPQTSRGTAEEDMPYSFSKE